VIDEDEDDDTRTELYDPSSGDAPPSKAARTVVSKPVKPAPKPAPIAKRSATVPPPIPVRAKKTQPPPEPTAKPAPLAKIAPAPAAAPKPVGHQTSGPMRAVSMKTPADVAAQKPTNPKVVRPKIPEVKLRSIAAQKGTPPRVTGNLAPPRDEREDRKQRLWSNTFWASIAVIIASIVALAIWLIAGRK